MKIFETHAHLDFKDFDKDRNQIFEQCKKEGITKIINVGIDEESSRNCIELAEKWDHVFAAIGYHPHDADKFDLEEVNKLYKHKKVVAIGEIGLDYFRNYSPKKKQIEVFRKQLEFAKKVNLPVIIHDRDAHEDCLAILKEFQPLDVVFHCYSGDEIMLDKILQEGWFVSFTGTITYKNSNQQNVVRLVPEDKFMIETDSPYLSPVPKRGKRNSPLHLRYIIEKIADIKRLPPKKIANLSYQNAMNFFRLTD